MCVSVKLSFYSVLLVSKAERFYDTLITSTVSLDSFFLRQIFIELHLIFAKKKMCAYLHVKCPILR